MNKSAPGAKQKNTLITFLLIGLISLIAGIYTVVQLSLHMRNNTYPQTIYTPLSNAMLQQRRKDFYATNDTSIKVKLNQYGYVDYILVPISRVATTKSDYDFHNEPSGSMKHNIIAFIKKNALFFGIGSDFSLPNRKWITDDPFTNAIGAVQTFQINTLHPQPLGDVFTGIPINADADPYAHDHVTLTVSLDNSSYPGDVVIVGHFWPTLNFPTHPKISESQIKSLYIGKTFNIHTYFRNPVATEKFKITSGDIATELLPSFFIRNTSYELRLVYTVRMHSPPGLQLVKEDSDPYWYKVNAGGIELVDTIDAMTGEKLIDNTSKYIE